MIFRIIIILPQCMAVADQAVNIKDDVLMGVWVCVCVCAMRACVCACGASECVVCVVCVRERI